MQEPSGLGVQDIFFILANHKWKIIVLTVVGLAAAAVVWFTATPLFESQAKLFVKYVVDRGVESAQVSGASSRQYDQVINTEVQILTSGDLALEVARALGPERVLPNAPGASEAQAAGAIRGGLNVTAGEGSAVISVYYRSQVPEAAVQTLNELVNQYFEKHFDVHRVGALQTVQEQTDALRSALTNTEDQLNAARTEAGTMGVPNENQLNELNSELRATMTELAGQKARLNLMSGAAETEAARETAATPEEIEAYKMQRALLAKLHSDMFALRTRYTLESRTVREQQFKIDQVERELAAMEAKYPGIAGALGGSAADLTSERLALAAIEAKKEFLEEQIRQVYNSAGPAGSRVAELMRKRENQRSRLELYERNLEQARLDQALDPSQIPNISVVQQPSVPARVQDEQLTKIALALAVGGLALGVGIAFLLELFVDRRIKRPIELVRMQVPLMLSIPYMKQLANGSARRLQGKNGSNSKGAANGASAEEWHGEPDPCIRPYADAIRDRLVQYFEVNKMTHKPKLVALTGFSHGDGTSMLASSLAASFSDMGEGKVLLVNANSGEGTQMHPFFEGRPVCSLSEALRSGEDVEARFKAADRYLFLATPDSQSKPMIPKQLHGLLPRFRSSDFDYILFDMPRLCATSPTVPMASFMDMNLVVIDSETTTKEQVKQGIDEMIGANAKLSCVLNKSRHVDPFMLPA